MANMMQICALNKRLPKCFKFQLASQFDIKKEKTREQKEKVVNNTSASDEDKPTAKSYERQGAFPKEFYAKR